MAGVKGRSGGWRPGAGRKPKAPVDVAALVAVALDQPQPAEDSTMPAALESVGVDKSSVSAVANMTPLDFLLKVMLGQIDANATQVKAASVAAQYVHVRKADGGKKDEQADKAKKVAAGKFAATPAPLKLVNGG